MGSSSEGIAAGCRTQILRGGSDVGDLELGDVGDLGVGRRGPGSAIVGSYAGVGGYYELSLDVLSPLWRQMRKQMSTTGNNRMCVGEQTGNCRKKKSKRGSTLRTNILMKRRVSPFRPMSGCASHACPRPAHVSYIYSSGTTISPSSIASMMSCGGLPSTVQPTDWAVPRISLTPPARFLANDLCAIFRAI